MVCYLISRRGPYERGVAGVATAAAAVLVARGGVRPPVHLSERPERRQNTAGGS